MEVCAAGGMPHFEQATDRVIGGLEKTNKVSLLSVVWME